MAKGRESGNLAGIFGDVKGLTGLIDPCRARMKVVSVVRDRTENGNLRRYSVQCQFAKVPKTLPHLQAGVHFENFIVGTEADPDAVRRETWINPENWAARRMRDFIEACGLDDKALRTLSPEDALKRCHGRHLMMQFTTRVDSRKTLRDGSDNPYYGTEQQRVRYYKDGERPVADLGKEARRTFEPKSVEEDDGDDEYTPASNAKGVSRASTADEDEDLDELEGDEDEDEDEDEVEEEDDEDDEDDED